MTDNESAKYDNLTDALKWYDEDSRLERAKRIDWASSLYQSTGLISGEIVPLSMMEEARACFVNGQNMASVLCATSAIEHLLVAEIESAGASSGNATLGSSIRTAETAQMYSAEVISDLREINELRNPLAHRREASDSSTLANRYLERKSHPDLITEQDARHSLKVMYKYFLQVLKSGV